MSEDPIGFNGGDVNFYRYAKSKPINFRDPTGLYSSSGNSCEQEVLEEYYEDHRNNVPVSVCEANLSAGMSLCEERAEEPETVEDLLQNPENEL